MNHIRKSAIELQLINNLNHSKAWTDTTDLTGHVEPNVMNLYSLFNALSVSHNAFWKVLPNPKGAAGRDVDSWYLLS